jgi:hypothetical protein
LARFLYEAQLVFLKELIQAACLSKFSPALLEAMNARLRAESETKLESMPFAGTVRTGQV